MTGHLITTFTMWAGCGVVYAAGTRIHRRSRR